MTDFDNNGYGESGNIEQNPADRLMDTGENKVLFKQELMDTFRKYGYIVRAVFQSSQALRPR